MDGQAADEGRGAHRMPSAINDLSVCGVRICGQRGAGGLPMTMPAGGASWSVAPVAAARNPARSASGTGFLTAMVAAALVPAGLGDPPGTMANPRPCSAPEEWSRMKASGHKRAGADTGGLTRTDRVQAGDPADFCREEGARQADRRHPVRPPKAARHLRPCARGQRTVRRHDRDQPPTAKNCANGSRRGGGSPCDRRLNALGHLVACQITVPLGLLLGGQDRSEQLGACRLPLPQKLDAGSHHRRHIVIAAFGNGLCSELLQFRGKRDVIHHEIIGEGGLSGRCPRVDQGRGGPLPACRLVIAVQDDGDE
jgi:hypothetical protein